jgi:hypothetical protein
MGDGPGVEERSTVSIGAHAAAVHPGIPRLTIGKEVGGVGARGGKEELAPQAAARGFRRHPDVVRKAV